MAPATPETRPAIRSSEPFPNEWRDPSQHPLQEQSRFQHTRLRERFGLKHGSYSPNRETDRRIPTLEAKTRVLEREADALRLKNKLLLACLTQQAHVASTQVLESNRSSAGSSGDAGAVENQRLLEQNAALLEQTKKLQRRIKIRRETPANDPDLKMLFCEGCHARPPQNTRGDHAIPEHGPARVKFAVMECCRKSLCGNCFPAAVTARLQGAIWHDLSRPDWVPCPVFSCENGFFTVTIPKIQKIYSTLGSQSTEMHLKILERACFLRQKLVEVAPALNGDAASAAERFHGRMHRWRFMDNPFLDLMGTKDVVIERLSVMSSDDSLVSIPVITSLLKRSETPKNCAICTEDLCDLEIGNKRAWKKCRQTFGSDVEWVAYPFPSESMIPQCAANHGITICRGCLSKHIDSRIELGARSAATIACPQPGCGHVYSYQELKALAKSETFAGYEKACLSVALSNEPNFRWCLRPGCKAGQIYDTQPGVCDMLSNLNLNTENGEVLPRSSGKASLARFLPTSCAEYEAQSQGASAESETQSWLKHNTKSARAADAGAGGEGRRVLSHGMRELRTALQGV
ncbi:unnamed protein product [Parascedosporium putredinis]|uniref:IBR domain-containing protein n=1 Tax=Parascedosporium putredinis TaxID=1442378 RepID=A0A9P1H901_9PEZI|nr:unnamed protein product [Parascedosporium putredinis]CAI7999795.1 unnamed protein product [Parascedosporium putredinis]